MKNELEIVNLISIMRGAAVERFDRELAEILRNIDDPNTPAEKARELTLKFKFIPNEERDNVGVLLEVTTKLASANGVTTRLNVGRIGGNLAAVEFDPRQAMLWDQGQTEQTGRKTAALPAEKEGVE